MKKNTSKRTESKRSRPEVGASGTTNFQGVIDTDEYVTDLTGQTLYTTIDKMRWSDASIQAALLLCELPIRSAEWDIEPASEDAQDVEIADFIKDNLFNGLTVPWEDTLRQILLMHPYGFMMFEKIYEMRADGKIGWRKWAPRLPKTIYEWHNDPNGELEWVLQRTYKNNNYMDIKLPVQKILLFINRREGDNYLGTSILRQAYKHWFFRDKYYKIDAVAQERMGIGIPIITLPAGYTDDDYTAAENMGKNLRGHEKAYAVKKAGWEIEMLDLKAGSLKDPVDMLEHHTREILKSVLAQFADLGSKAGGSYALNESQTQLFLASLDASAKSIEDVINDEIKILVDYNWNVEKYPKLTHADLGVKNVKELAESIQTLSLSQVLTPDPNLEKYMRKVLKLPDIPVEYEEVQELELKSKIDFLKNPEKYQNQNQSPNQNQNKQENKPPENKQAHSEYHREFTRWEQRVRFDELRDYMDASEREVKNMMLSILTREKANLIPLFEDAIRRKDFADLHRISWKLKSVYSQLFRDQIKKLFEFGKLKASYEIRQPASLTDSEVTKQISERAFFLANRHEKQMMEELKGIAAVAMMDSNVSDEQAIARVSEGISRFEQRNVPATASLITAESINDGRIFTFENFKDELYGYQWSAILDPHTCNYCYSIDGRTIGVNDRAFAEYRPGRVHFFCRCIWVAITKEEDNPPPFTGVPDILVPQTEMATWEFKDLQYPLAGAGKRKTMPYGVGVYKE